MPEARHCLGLALENLLSIQNIKIPCYRGLGHIMLNSINLHKVCIAEWGNDCMCNFSKVGKWVAKNTYPDGNEVTFSQRTANGWQKKHLS